MAGTSERLDLIFRGRARHQAHPELAEDTVGVEHRRAVHLGEGVPQRSEVRGRADLQRRRRREPLLDGGTGLRAGPVDEKRADAPRTEVVNGELQHRLEHVTLARERRRSDAVEPCRDGWLVMPRQLDPTEDAEAPHEPNRAGGMPLHDRGVQHGGQHYEIAFGGGGPVEQHPLVVAVRAPHEPARQPVGEPA